MHIRRSGTQKVRAALFATTSACLALTVAACSSSSSGSGDSGGAATVKIGIFPGNTSSSVWVIADQQKFFQRQGIKATFINFTSGPSLAAAVVSGSVDVAYGASSVSFDVARQSSKLLVLGDFVQRVAYPVVVAQDKARSTAAAGFPQNVRSLKGLTIGVTALGGIVNKYMDAVVTSAGLKTGDVKYLATGTVQSALSALKNGKVDALAANPPQAIAQAGIKAVKVVDPLVQGNAGPAATNALGELDTTSSSYRQKNAATLTRYCKAMRAAVTWTKDPSNLAAATRIVAKQLDLPTAQARSELSDAIPTYSSGLPETLWNGQPAWLTGGHVPDYGKTVDASCGQ